MTKESIKSFFNKYASTWDEGMVKNDEIINTILSNAKIEKGFAVLDVACGTGVLIPDYLNLEVDSVVGVDISDEMLKIAEKKFHQPNVSFICADAETYTFPKKFDAIVIYNAFPHFPNPENLINHLADSLKAGGTFTIAHGMSREKINEHHRGCAKDVSLGLMEIDALASLFEKKFNVITKISDNKMYQVVGVKK